MKNLLRFVLTLGFALVAAQTIAAPPQTINYQGDLTDPGGTPINQPVVMTFRLYNVALGGAALYTEIQNPITVSNGSFNAVIGAVTPITLPFDVPYWLGVSVNGDQEMAPRQPLASSPYAFRAAALDSTATLAGSQLSGSISLATLPSANLVGTVSSAQIANNAVTQAKLSPTNMPAAGSVLGTNGSTLQWQTVGAGSVTSVVAGAGLTGGTITATGTIGLSATSLLPTTACATNQIPKWNGVAWTCATNVSLPVGALAGQVLGADIFGPLWTDSPYVAGNLQLASSTASTGNITKFGVGSFIHNFGVNSTFLGVDAGNFAMSGSGNTGVGLSSLGNILTGNGNTALGTFALSNNTSGGGNIAIGASAGSANNVGNSNIHIGNTGVATDNLTIRIGSIQDRTFISGISFATIPSSVAVLIDSTGRLGTNTSSRRYKDDITDMDIASNALMQLRPVTFHYKIDLNPAGRTLQYGLIAEEVAEVYPGLVARSADGQIETVMYQHLPPMLLNEFQKQQRTIAAQAARVAELEQKSVRVETLERDLLNIKALLGVK